MISNNEAAKELSSLQNFRFKPVEVAPGLTMLMYQSYVHHYFRVPTRKERIILHYTAGSLAGDIQTLISPRKISVAYVIGRGGQIINLFPDSCWAYHLGRDAIGGNGTMSSSSIGIEISNWGWLTKGQGIMWTYPTSQGPKPYCLESETHLWTTTPEYRGKTEWATFTDQQYESLQKLLAYLTRKHNIPYQFLPEEERLQLTQRAVEEKGIFSHVNYRGQNRLGGWDKWDVGPAFDFNRIQNAQIPV